MASDSSLKDMRIEQLIVDELVDRFFWTSLAAHAIIESYWEWAHAALIRHESCQQVASEFNRRFGGYVG